MDGARIKANQIANLRLMAVLNYRFAVALLLDSNFVFLRIAAHFWSRKQKKATRGDGSGSSSYL
jgi:hypothetical protein